jgi:hypothetical protein
MSWRYISDAITKDEALAMLKAKEATKKEREAEVKKRGYPAYTTSVGWLGESFIFLYRQLLMDRLLRREGREVDQAIPKPGFQPLQGMS